LLPFGLKLEFIDESSIVVFIVIYSAALKISFADAAE
jgi:hypothetical protein